jgi:hypothetical protein
MNIKKPKPSEMAIQNKDWFKADFNSTLWLFLLKYPKSKTKKSTIITPNKTHNAVCAVIKLKLQRRASKDAARHDFVKSKILEITHLV